MASNDTSTTPPSSPPPGASPLGISPLRTSPPGSPPPYEAIPAQEAIWATCFKEQPYHHDDPDGKPGSEMWIVNSSAKAKAETGKAWFIWIEPAFHNEKKAYDSAFLGWNTGFDRKEGK